MKKLMIIGVLLMAVAMSAQEIKPTFEKEGTLLKGTFYYDNGNVQQEGTYKNGKLDGEWIMYNQEGKKIALAHYKDGKKTGKWFFWDNDKLTEVDYSSNSIANVNYWKNTSSVVSK